MWLSLSLRTLSLPGGLLGPPLKLSGKLCCLLAVLEGSAALAAPGSNLWFSFVFSDRRVHVCYPNYFTDRRAPPCFPCGLSWVTARKEHCKIHSATSSSCGVNENFRVFSGFEWPIAYISLSCFFAPEVQLCHLFGFIFQNSHHSLYMVIFQSLYIQYCHYETQCSTQSALIYPKKNALKPLHLN